MLLTMTSRIVTITSKNQITLPAELVRRLQLTRNRRLSIVEKKGTLELKPEPSIEQTMAPIWKEVRKQRSGKRKITDEMISNEARDAYAAVKAKDHSW